MLKAVGTKILVGTLMFSLLLTGCAKKEEAKTPEGQQGAIAGSVQIKGSDTMVNLVQAWAEDFMDKNPDASVAVTGGGSGTGIAALINGTTDIAMASREIKEKEVNDAKAKGIDVKETVVALDGIAVVVNKDNPVDKLTLAQIKDIYTGKINNWKEVGGPDLKIVVLSRESNSGTYAFFKEHVLNNENFRPDALLLPSTSAEVKEIQGNKGAIAYMGLGYVNETVKAVKVAKDASDAGLAPNLETVKSGEYPISRKLYLYSAGEPKGVGKAFIDYALSSDGQKTVEEMGFIPLK